VSAIGFPLAGAHLQFILRWLGFPEFVVELPDLRLNLF
jgi:hypothetical protein